MEPVEKQQKSNHGRHMIKPRWKKGESGNPKGRPKLGNSWAEAIRWATSRTPKELAGFLGASFLTTQLNKMPQNVSLKHLIIARWIVAQMNDPSPALAGIIMDREEGKPVQPVDMNVNSPLSVIVEPPEPDEPKPT
jgi:hypothetical protein